MPSIFGTNCDFLNGMLPDAPKIVKLFAVSGQDGAGVQNLGKFAGKFVLRAVKIDTQAGVEAWATVIQGYQAGVGSITTDTNTRTNCVITNVSQPVIRAAGTTKKKCILKIEGYVRP